ncbi:MAG: NAD(P)/FAD-dependent oxidoreductase, partial [Dehalococcoidia bacterium]
ANTGPQKRVVILGAGSAGISAALALKKASAKVPQVEVTLVDQKNYHFILPMTYQIVTGSVAPSHISFPVRKLLRQRGGARRVNFRQAQVQAVDVETKKVITDEGELGWDYLVVALGSTTNFFGMDDVAETAVPFRSLVDGINIHNRILDSYEAAVSGEDEQGRREPLTFVVVGGGPTGVELAASIRELASKVLAKDYPSLTPLVRVLLIEAQETVLPGMKAKTQELAIARLRSRGVEVMLKTRISKAWPGGVHTSDGDTIPTRTVIWCAGIKPIPVVDSLPFAKAKDGRILVNQYLQVVESPGVYAIGDCAYLEQEDGSGPYPPTFQVAFRQGRVCARNVLNAIKGKPQRPYRSKFVGQIFYVDRNTAVAELFGHVFDGFIAGMMRRGLFIGMLFSYGGLLTGLKSKLSAALDWTFAYFYNRNTARLE